jgi:hypothetical protein
VRLTVTFLDLATALNGKRELGTVTHFALPPRSAQRACLESTTLCIGSANVRFRGPAEESRTNLNRLFLVKTGDFLPDTCIKFICSFSASASHCEPKLQQPLPLIRPSGTFSPSQKDEGEKGSGGGVSRQSL